MAAMSNLGWRVLGAIQLGVKLGVTEIEYEVLSQALGISDIGPPGSMHTYEIGMLGNALDEVGDFMLPFGIIPPVLVVNKNTRIPSIGFWQWCKENEIAVADKQAFVFNERKKVVHYPHWKVIFRQIKAA